MKAVIWFLAIVFGLNAAVPAQSAALWRGLEFGMSEGEVLAKAGQAKRSRTGKGKFGIETPKGVKRRTDTRTLIYEKTEGWEKVEVSLLDGELRAIEMWPRNKTVAAADIPEQFGSDFLFVEAFHKDVKLASFEGQKETTVPKVYPTVYSMLAVLPDRYVVALINNGSFKAILKDGFNKPTITMFPGYVESVMIFRRDPATEK